MPLKAHADKIRKILWTTYPKVTTQLDFKTPFELLVATILSAQCTDKQVNKVTVKLFNSLKSPRDFVDVPLAELEALIRSTGFYRNKAKNIKGCAKALVENHAGQVPETLAEMTALAGVGRKTANVVLGAAFGVAGIPVDTHVGRISRRLGLTTNKNPVKIEFDLMALIPKVNWSNFSLRLIYFGRETCSSRKPACFRCPLAHLCPYPDKTPKFCVT